MNNYGRQAQQHWTRVAPGRVRELEDAEAFFTDLGEQVEQQIANMWPAIAGPDVPGESVLEKTGRLNAARRQAEEIALSELVWLPQEEIDDLEELRDLWWAETPYLHDVEWMIDQLGVKYRNDELSTYEYQVELAELEHLKGITEHFHLWLEDRKARHEL